MARPSFKPTPEQRLRVKGLACIGMRQEHIAEDIGLRSTKSLRKHFPKELHYGQRAAVAAVARVAFEMAESGKFPTVTEFWLETVGSATVASAANDSVMKIRSYEDQPKPGREHEYKRTATGEYMHEQIIAGPAKKSKALKQSLKTESENHA